MKNFLFLSAIVSIVGTGAMAILSYLFGAEIVFVVCAMIIFIAGVIVVPYKQFKKSYKAAKEDDKQKAFHVDHYVIYARNQAEAQAKVTAIKNSFEQRKAERKHLELSKPLSN